MEEVYKKLLEQLAQMTPEQKAEEWKALKEYNEIGPGVEEYVRRVEGFIAGGMFAVNEDSCDYPSFSEYFLAA